MYKATAIMGMATFISLLMGAVKAKFLALSLGPIGVGIFAQGMTFFQSAETICELGLSTGITKYVSLKWKSGNSRGVREIISSAVLLQSAAFILFFIMTLLFSKAMSRFVFSSVEYASALILISIAVPFSSSLIAFESSLIGLARPDIHSKGRIVYNIIGVTLLISLVSLMKLQGVFFFIPVNALISILLVYFFLTYAMRERVNSVETRPTAAATVKIYPSTLLSYGAVMLLSSSLTWVTILYVRSLLIKYEGPAANGLYQVAFGLVSYYTPFFINGVWGYLFPKLSAVSEEAIFNIEVNKMLRFILLFLTPAISVLFLLKKIIVILIFSKEFLGSLEILPLYLIGSLFFMVSYIFGTIFLAKRELRPYFAITVLQNILYVLLFIWLVDRLGLLAISVSYCVTNLIGCLLCVSYQVFRARLKINIDNVRLFLLSVVFIVVIFFVPFKHAIYDILKWALLAMWAIFVIGKREKALLLSFIRNR